ncbi:hypothetical protein WJ47_02790 [Burkholderia ubonensis]|uniref:Uncharacterized protein n=1 Tax=Burkholderia ubonensis TaxID=101571 RepID=A0AB73FYA0_9BURK|nr:hypothetical protein [Burkholderia ubonensis]KVK88740.1 hypothetical protein WJ44_29340 [Burkholderia ubonensis]KVL72716.1 hypothetical protein WJ47_02790 [Burkholderia ubonensis]KVM23345.1 hypothetical protein WJ53_17860 [Burkholderia ubonensis]KVM29643.1 hypothetical protein WJ54_11795 [Burkholderia ubonensis]KVT81374.1 hypothetical protein WK59_18725 [Burkholderia ubonensis]
MARIQTESGVRNAQQDTYNGRKIEVVTGYDALSDKWPFHIYIDGTKLVGQWKADGIAEAFDVGFQIAQEQIDAA